MKRYIKILTLVFTLSFLWGCLEDPEVYKIIVKTDSTVEFVQGGVSLNGGIYTENEKYQPTIDSCGFCYGIEENPTLSNFVVKVKNSGVGDFNATLKSLYDGTKYYVRAFAQNKYGVVYGEEVSFVSLTKPTVKTLSLSEDNENSQLIVECELESLGSGEITELGVCYSSENKLPNKENDEYKLVSNIQKGKYTVSIPVEPNVKYYVRAFASNLAGVAYGEVKEILTTEAIYTIKFDANGGVGSMEEISTAPSKEVQLISNSFTRTGYTFTGWNTKTDGSGTTYYDEQNISIDSDLTLYAQWTPIYTITFNANGGSGSMSSKTVSSGYSVSLPANTFTRSGYEFVGWNTNADGSGVPYTIGQNITPSGNITLYAQWKKIENNQEQVSGSHQGHNYVDLGLPSGTFWATCNVGATKAEEYGDYFAWGETSTKTQYTSSNYAYSGNPTTLPLSNDAANVNWGGDWRMPTKTEQEELRNSSYTIWTWTEQNFVTGYRVTSKINGNSIFLPAAGVMSSSLNEVNRYGNYWSSSYGVNYPIGLYFKSEFVHGSSFYSHQGLSVRPVIPVNSSVEPEQPTLYTITFNANGGSGSMSSQTVSSGASVTLPNSTFTRSGYEFVGWNTNADGTGTSYTDGQIITPSGNISLYAQWKKKDVYYTITFNSNGGSGSMSSKTVRAGSSFYLPINTLTRSGYEFVGWNTNSYGTGTSYTDGQFITPPGNISLYAQWKKIEEDQEQVNGSHMGHNYVDLGLPSGTLWATCNVGATKAEEYGDYFAWGETSTKFSYTASNYTFTDYETTLPLRNDAANVNWGGEWHTPKRKELNELSNSSYTIWTWVNQNGVEGYKVVSRSNGNSIFLPAAGFIDGSDMKNVGTSGNYWSSSITTGYSYLARGIGFKSSNVWEFSGDRYSGKTIRPIMLNK